jgi:glycine dehydrogenase subunit 1
MSFGGVKTPAEWGADIAVGDTQVFGLPQYCGGPAVGYIAADRKMLRKMPGRIVGETTDSSGRRVFVLTLQAREQHIKRERATSNICTNQALAALTSSVYLSLVGPAGLEDVFSLCYQKAHYLYSRLKNETHVQLFSEPFFNEFTLQLGDKAQPFLKFMLEKGIFAGVHLGELDAELSGSVTAAVTEKRTKEELDRYADAAKEFFA